MIAVMGIEGRAHIAERNAPRIKALTLIVEQSANADRGKLAPAADATI